MAEQDTDDDVLDAPAPDKSATDPYRVAAFVPQPDAKPVAPYQPSIPASNAGLLGIWPPPGSTPGPMTGPSTQTSIRSDGTVAPQRPPVDPRRDLVDRLGIQSSGEVPPDLVPNTGNPPSPPGAIQTASLATAPAHVNARTLGAFPPQPPSPDDNVGAGSAKPPWQQARLMIMGPESGGQNVFNYRHNEGPQFSASGLFQITDSTWRDGGKLAGIDVSQWQHAIDAPPEVQDKVAEALYNSRGFSPWSTQAGGPLNLDGSKAAGNARSLGVGASYDDYLRRALAMNPRGYDPSSINAQLRANYEAQRAAEQPLIEARQRIQQREEAEADEQYSRMKTEEDLNNPALQPWTQKPPQPDPVGGLASLGSVFAALASGFSHTPGVAAMNGIAAAIDARNEGNQKQYDEAFKAYQYNANLALKRNAIVQEAYDKAWARVKENPELGLAELRSVAQIYGDERTELLAESGNLEEADKINQARITNAQKLAESLAKLDQTAMFGPAKGSPEYQLYIQERDKLVAAGTDPYEASKIANEAYEQRMRNKSVAGQRSEQEATIAKGQYKELYGREPTDADMKTPEMAELLEQAHSSAGLGGPEAVKRMAEKIANYQMPPVSIARAVGAAVMAEVAKIAPDYDAKLYSAENKALGNFYGGTEGRSVRSINVAIAHLDTLDDLTDALRNGDTKRFNQIANTVAQETGSAAPTNFALAKQIVGAEINKAIVPGVGGVSERQALADDLNAANSPEQLQGVIATAQKLLAGQTAGLKTQFTGTTGQSGETFDKLLMDRTKQVLGTSAADAGKARPPAATIGAVGPAAAQEINSKDAYDALPSGSHYRKPGDPPDSYRTKP
jgi:hypothetical protein